MRNKFKTQKLMVEYEVFGKNDVNEFLDKGIEKLANACGLEFVGSGFDLETKTRDLIFEASFLGQGD